MRWIAALIVLVACTKPRPIPPGTPDQTIHDAMVLVCDAPARADGDRSSGSRSDKIAGHLTDGIGNALVLTTVEGWKTDGIKRGELDALLAKAKLMDCALKAEAVGALPEPVHTFGPFQAGADPDGDGDGLPDAEDRCPTTWAPPAAPGIRPVTGCPSNQGTK